MNKNKNIDSKFAYVHGASLENRDVDLLSRKSPTTSSHTKIPGYMFPKKGL